MTTSSDAPSLDCAYKLQEYAGRPCRKRSEGKATWPGRKQVYRHGDGPEGRLAYDVVTTLTDRQEGRPLLQEVMKEGRRVIPLPSLSDIRAQAQRELASLPDPLRGLDEAPPFDVRISPTLQDLAKTVDERG